MNMPLNLDAVLAPRTAKPRTGRFADWPLALKAILAFWAVYTLTVVARAFLGSDPLTVLQNKILTIVAGMIFTAGIYVALRMFAAEGSMRRKAIVAGTASILAAVGLTATLIFTEHKLRESKEEFRVQAREGFIVVQKGHQIRIERGADEPLVVTMPRIKQLQEWEQFRIAADTTVVWLFFFAAWSAFYLAAVSQAQALVMQRRAAEAENAAQVAQVRALRYQVNPHFLFNTLNSLSSLVMTGRPEEAESMILKLSTFFRNSLSMDPTADVSLEEEIALQQLYLDIEQVRFPRRLKVEIDVPEHLRSVRLPALILQPIVENAIKYGVSQTREKIILRIAAEEPLPGRLRLEVTNNGKTAGSTRTRQRERPAGTGVGLSNVCQRLQARFGASATCEFGAAPEGGYRVVMTLPVTRLDG